MKQYKPEFLGKVIPADDASGMRDFVQNKYDSFSKIYDTCKGESESISDIKPVDSSTADQTSLSVKISTDRETMDKIESKSKGDSSISVTDDVVSAVSE